MIDLRRLRVDDPALPALEGAAERRRHGWEVRARAGGRLPGHHLAERRLGRVPRHAGQEGPPRDQAQDPPRGGRRRPVASSSPRRPRSRSTVHRPAQAPLRRGRPLPDTDRAATAAVTSCTAWRSSSATRRTAAAAVGPRALRRRGSSSRSSRSTTASTCYLYNAGMDPGARDLSPGVTGTAMYLRDRLEAGRRRFDFLRGDEPYKYEWGARTSRSSGCWSLREAERAWHDRRRHGGHWPAAPAAARRSASRTSSRASTATLRCRGHQPV